MSARLTKNIQSDKEAPDWLCGDLTLVHSAIPGLEVFYLQRKGFMSCNSLFTNRMMELNIETFPFIFKQSPFTATNNIYINVVCNR